MNKKLQRALALTATIASVLLFVLAAARETDERPLGWLGGIGICGFLLSLVWLGNTVDPE
jgi:hypothetical protein